jgi:hypothetical protein
MVTKKIASPVAIAPTVPATEAPASTPAFPAATPAKLPARKRAIVAKPAAKKVPLKPAASAAPAPAPAEKMPLPEKAKKVKMVRDSFTMPKAEYAALDELKQRAALLGCLLKKSELLRVGIKLLATLPDAPLLAALAEVSSLKSGQRVIGN